MQKYHNQLVIYFYVAHFMSFSEAAKHLNYSKSYVSKQISELERSIGCLLFYRNTRTIKLTLAGESVFEHAERIVQEIQSVDNTVASLQHKAQGLLRITSPSAFADHILAPHIPTFFEYYPDIQLEMNFTEQLLNLVDKKIDVAIRLTHEPPLDRVAKRVGDYQMIICAAPNYCAKQGEPKTPIQLREHECLIYATEKNCRNWPFMVNGQAIRVDVKTKIAANSSQVLLNAAIAGVGIARLPDYVVSQAIQDNVLQPLLSQYYPIATPIYAIYAQSKIIPPKIHAFIEFIQKINGRYIKI